MPHTHTHRRHLGELGKVEVVAASKHGLDLLEGLLLHARVFGEKVERGGQAAR